MRDFYLPVDSPNLIDGFDFGTESAMDTENFSIDDGSNREVIKDFSTIFPWIRISIFSINFIIESIDCGDLSK
jgi:hypothetical protein